MPEEMPDKVMEKITEQDWDKLQQAIDDERQASRPLAWTAETPEGKYDFRDNDNFLMVNVGGRYYAKRWDGKQWLWLGPLPEVPR